jgi:16S rRNA (cytosine967-C5)-methyltransferase
VRLLQETVRRSGAGSVKVVQLATDGPLPFRVPFDRVLVDAPCSGLGTIWRDPDIRWRRTPADLARFAGAQGALLQRAADAVRPDGGRLIYATCSSEPEENDAVVAAFLSEQPAFERVNLRTEPVSGAEGLVDEEGFFRTQPHLHRLEAFFAAVLRRR